MGPNRQNIDHGWAWLVMIAVYLGVFIGSISVFMHGVIYITLLDKYQGGETKTSLVGAISSGFLCFGAPLGGAINNISSCRTSVLIGGVLATIGFALSAFVPSLDWMILTCGVLNGLGCSIYSSGQICALGFYFEKRRDMVLAIAHLTPGVGMVVASPLGLYLIHNFGLTSTFLILACISAHACVVGVICKPSVIEKEIHLQKKSNRSDKEESILKSYIDLTLLRNVPYIGFLCSTATWNFALTVAIMHLPNYISVLGRIDADITYVMSSFSVANIVGRLAGSVTVSNIHQKSIYVHVIVLAITGVMSSLFPLYSKIDGGVYMFAIQLGLFSGWPNTMMTPLSLSFVGVTKLSEAYALAYVFCGIGVTTGPVLIGYLYSTYGSYEYSFLLAGCVLIVGSLFGVATLCCQRQKSKDHKNTGINLVDDSIARYSNRNINNEDVNFTLINNSSK